MKIRTKVKVVDNTAGHGFRLGEIVEYIGPSEYEDESYKFKALDGEIWYLNSEDFEILDKPEQDYQELLIECWNNFNIHSKVFEYLLDKGYVEEVKDGDDWEVAADNIINAIKNIEKKVQNK